MADLRAEMTSYLGKLNGDQSQEAPESNENESNDKPVEKDDADSENQLEEDDEEKPSPKSKKEEKKEDEEDDEESESKDEEKESDKEKDKDKDKKPNRYQRIKKQRDEALAQVSQVKGEFHKAVKVAKAWRAEALAFEKELNKVKEEAKQAGYSRSDKDDALFDYERERVGRQVEEEFDKELTQEQKKEQVRAVFNQMKDKFQEEAISLASKYNIRDQKGNYYPKKILARLYADRQAGEDVTMEDVAKELAGKNRKSPEERQIEVNEDAPRPQKKGKGAPPDYSDSSPEGMLRFLKAKGLG